MPAGLEIRTRLGETRYTPPVMIIHVLGELRPMEVRRCLEDALLPDLPGVE